MLDIANNIENGSQMSVIFCRQKDISRLTQLIERELASSTSIDEYADILGTYQAILASRPFEDLFTLKSKSSFELPGHTAIS